MTLTVRPADGSSELTHASLSRLDARFRELAAPNEAELKGRFRARFVGPWWLRVSAGPSVALAGLRGFWGKELQGYGPAINIVERGGRLSTALPMELSLASSLRDGGACALLSYPRSSPFPWPHVRDELRVLAEGVLLALTIIDAPLLRRLAFPFLLVRSAG